MFTAAACSPDVDGTADDASQAVSAATGTVYQAEAASVGGGTTIDADHAGFTGTGFANFSLTGGYVSFGDVSSVAAGSATVTIRFANGSGSSRTGALLINGVAQGITFPATGSWTTWKTISVPVNLNGGTNTIRLESTGQDLANIDRIDVAVSASGTDNLSAARQACVDKINAFRATDGKRALARWTAQESCVDGEARADSISGKAHSAFGACGEFAQNECPGWPSTGSITASGGCLDSMWAEGPGSDFEAHGHYINMSNTNYTMVACGFYTTATGSVWAAQDFR